MSYDWYSTGKHNEQKPEFTFEKRLWREMTNAFGDPLDADSMKRILFQLKRFLFLARAFLSDQIQFGLKDSVMKVSDHR